jgi:DUF2911 family protein
MYALRHATRHAIEARAEHLGRTRSIRRGVAHGRERSHAPRNRSRSRLRHRGQTLAVPAGRYTLFSVPERDGGWLIINRQTGQAGTAHDPARDLGRVRLSTRPLPAPVETFTIKVEAEGAANLLHLQWDGSERVVRFRVRTTK